MANRIVPTIWTKCTAPQHRRTVRINSPVEGNAYLNTEFATVTSIVNKEKTNKTAVRFFMSKETKVKWTVTGVESCCHWLTSPTGHIDVDSSPTTTSGNCSYLIETKPDGYLLLSFVEFHSTQVSITVIVDHIFSELNKWFSSEIRFTTARIPTAPCCCPTMTAHCHILSDRRATHCISMYRKEYFSK